MPHDTWGSAACLQSSSTGSLVNVLGIFRAEGATGHQVLTWLLACHS